MTDTYNILQGFIAAEKLVHDVHLKLLGQEYAWHKLYRVVRYIRDQQLTLGAAYFSDNQEVSA